MGSGSRVEGGTGVPSSHKLSVIWVMLLEGACAPTSSEMCFTTCHTHGSGTLTKNQFMMTQN